MSPGVNSVVMARIWGGLTAAAGVVTLILATRGREPGSTGAPRLVVGALGARQVVQGAIIVLAPTPDLVTFAVGVEILHGSSMLPVAAWPRYRRPALLAAGQAALFALAGGAIISTPHT